MAKLRARVIYFKPTVQVGQINMTWSLYKSDQSPWPGPPAGAPVTKVQLAVRPGAVGVDISLPNAPLDKLWIAASGIIDVLPASRSIFVAEPPDTLVPDDQAFQSGPPWISLKDLNATTGLSGELWNVNGAPTRQGGGSLYWEHAHQDRVGVWSINLA